MLKCSLGSGIVCTFNTKLQISSLQLFLNPVLEKLTLNNLHKFLFNTRTSYGNNFEFWLQRYTRKHFNLLSIFVKIKGMWLRLGNVKKWDYQNDPSFRTPPSFNPGTDFHPSHLKIFILVWQCALLTPILRLGLQIRPTVRHFKISTKDFGKCRC